MSALFPVLPRITHIDSFSWIIVILLNLGKMLKRIPTSKDGKPIDLFSDSLRLNKPFKTPTMTVQREQPLRKRKRVSYKGAQGDEPDDDDDDENGSGSKSKKRKTGRDGYEAPRDNNVRVYPRFSPKPFEEVSRKFVIPAMKNSDGEYVRAVPTNAALGLRPLTRIIPRPLHDPMEDHAIVLFDPTIDDRETDEERKAREKEEEEERAKKEAVAKNVGLYNPHGKSLKELLGDPRDRKKQNPKVAVVIDPRLTKILRPHQVEGVKVRWYTTCKTGRC